MTTLALIAKETLPGRVKTRLNPPLSLRQAATLAAASLADTLFVSAQVAATTRLLFFDGELIPSGAENFEVVPQGLGDLDERLGALFDNCIEPMALIGMDTPQLRADTLAPLFAPWPEDIDAWFGPASDGGFWCLALAEPDGSLLRGVPMSRSNTGQIQLDRLRARGLRVGILPTLTDVDTFADALEVAALAPFSRFAATLADLVDELAAERAADLAGAMR